MSISIRVLPLALMSLWTVSAHAQNAPAPTTSPGKLVAVQSIPTDLNANEQALSSELERFLEDKYGSTDALFKLLTGNPKAPNQSLTIVVPSEAIALGPLTYSKEAQLKVKAVTQNIENCNRDDPVQETVSTSTTITDTSTWSATKTQENSMEHAVSVSDKVKLPAGLGELTTSYSFKDTEKTGSSSTQGGSEQKSTTVAYSVPLIARKNRSEYYRGEIVQMVGNNATFTASATVNSSRPIEFYISAKGYYPVLYGAPAGTQMIAALDNTPPATASQPAANLELGQRALVSPSGAFAHYQFQDRDKKWEFAWLDYSRSTPSNPKLLHEGLMPVNPLVEGACDTPLRLVLQTDGDAVWYCGRYARGSTDTHVSKGNPCFYMTFRVLDGPDVGQLACYKRNVAGMVQKDADKYLTWRSPIYEKHGPTNPNMVTNLAGYYTLQQIAGVVQQEFNYVGTFSGTQTISPQAAYCSYGFDLTPNPKNPARCQFAPHAGSADRLCDSTRKYLEPYLRTHSEESLLSN